MSEIIFIYKGNEVTIQIQKGEKMKNILERLANKINVSKDKIFGLYRGTLIDEETNEDEIQKDENDKRIILIYDINNTTIKSNLINSKEVICPICKENCLMKIEEYKLILYNCKNKHETNLLINEFDETQKIDLSKIICNICNSRNKGNTYNNQFFKCINCKINLCPICKSKHNNEHNIINYDKINNICNNHGEPYFGYCMECNKNICVSCEYEHDNHNIITYGKIIGDKNKIIEKNKILRQDIDIFTQIIKDIKDKLNDVINNIEKLFEINTNIINNKNKNYEILYNIANINSNDIHKDILNIIQEKDINLQFNYVMKIFKQMNTQSINKNIKNNKQITNKLVDNKSIKNEITIKYKVEKVNNKIKIFGEDFVKNNKDKCKYIFKNKEYELTDKFDLKNYDNSKGILKIKLTGLNKVTDLSHLFDYCESLLEVPDISELDISNVIKLNHLFYYCSSLQSIPDISNWKTFNVTHINNIFTGCKSLKSIPDISKWNTSKVINMKYIFWDCESLLSLPNISNWDTSNVKNMEGLFGFCKFLKSLPDISNWNINKNKTVSSMFCSCESLISLPDISKWDFSNVEFMGEKDGTKGLFSGCKSLISLPDISKWDTSKVMSMNNLFKNCSSLKILPVMSKWNTSRVR